MFISFQTEEMYDAHPPRLTRAFLKQGTTDSVQYTQTHTF